LLFAAGILMGQAFPLGMRLASPKAHLTLWLWAMNGAMSVCASVLAVVLALFAVLGVSDAWGDWRRRLRAAS
jgi:hypothetical protein